MTISHQRKRHAMTLLLQKLRFSPIVSIQGPRQVGKSYLVKNLLPQEIDSLDYVSLDQRDHRSFALSNPHSFLKQSQKKHLAIDEVQKAPDLFDEVKSIVDEKRTPGQFILLGSTEFSIETQIRESLTGRLSRVRLYPLSLAETKNLVLNQQKHFPFVNVKARVQKNDLLKYLENGGLPGIFSVRNENERKSLIEDWLNLTAERDLHQVKKYKLESEVAIKIIEQVATLETPDLIHIANELRLSTKKVQNHLIALKMLFVLFEIKPFPGSSGKPLFYLTDTSFLKHFNCSFSKKLTTWLYLELLSQMAYKGETKGFINYFKSRASTSLNVVYSKADGHLNAIKLVTSEFVDKRDVLIFESFKKKYKAKFDSIDCVVLYGGQANYDLNGIKVFPWENII